ncbi:MAG TPA: helix-turn-helix domain-containing protein [Tenuifilaceae bacterium]|nr:helix-turn-helix domain-containing protein [Tenuifilaceae bacterium]
MELLSTLIEQEKTGTPKEFAKQLGISERTLNRYLNILRHEYHVDIAYSRISKSYYYKNSVEIIFTIKTDEQTCSKT